MNPIVHLLFRSVKILLLTAIVLVLLRSLFAPSALDIIILLLLFLVFITLFVGRPPV
jgi:hypothetical protein